MVFRVPRYSSLLAVGYSYGVLINSSLAYSYCLSISNPLVRAFGHGKEKTACIRSTSLYASSAASGASPLDAVLGLFQSVKPPSPEKQQQPYAKDVIINLVKNLNCYTTREGAIKFGNTCADGVVYEDCSLKDPILGNEVRWIVEIAAANLWPLVAMACVLE